MISVCTAFHKEYGFGVKSLIYLITELYKLSSSLHHQVKQTAAVKNILMTEFIPQNKALDSIWWKLFLCKKITVMAMRGNMTQITCTSMMFLPVAAGKKIRSRQQMCLIASNHIGIHEHDEILRKSKYRVMHVQTESNSL